MKARPLRSILIAEGSSDGALCPVLDWVIAQHCAAPCDSVQFVDFSRFGKPPKLQDRVRTGLDNYPCELIFIHRDADSDDPAQIASRYQEIAGANISELPHVAVVPIHMQEAWFFLDETVLRRAVGRPSGREPLEMPKLSEVERRADPKSDLHGILRKARAATGRDARKFSPADAIRRMSYLIQDWSPLRQLSAFRRLEEDTRLALLRLQAPE